MAKIEATGNDLDSALLRLAIQRNDLKAKSNALFNEPMTFGNSEIGYKVVQYYVNGAPS